jgi:hypothetical protein
MENKSNSDKILLTLLCNDLFYQIKDIVNNHAVKQTDKDVINAEEVMIRVLYRDSVDMDIVHDLGILLANDFYIVNQIKMSKKGDK